MDGRKYDCILKRAVFCTLYFNTNKNQFFTKTICEKSFEKLYLKISNNSIAFPVPFTQII